MTYRISKQFAFSASHILLGLPSDHQCGRLHGHNYTVEIELESETLNESGFVIDYGDLSLVKDWIDSTLDHRHLNDVVGPEVSPTSEFVAKWIHEETVQILEAKSLLDRGDVTQVPPVSVSAVRVYETPKTCAEFRPTVSP